MPPPPQPGILLYQTEDGRTRIQYRFEHETIWLAQIQLAELLSTCVPNINLHLKATYAEGELTEQTTIKSCLRVRSEGARPVRHCECENILVVGHHFQPVRPIRVRVGYPPPKPSQPAGALGKAARVRDFGHAHAEL